MKPLAVIASVALSIGSFAMKSFAQSPTDTAGLPVLVPGARVRVMHTPESDSLGHAVGELQVTYVGELQVTYGALRSVSPAGITVFGTGTMSSFDSTRDLTFPLNHVYRLEVVSGKGSHAVGYAIAGLLVGAGIGALQGASDCGEFDLWGRQHCTNEARVVRRKAIVGASLSFAIGALLGAASSTDKWTTLPQSVLEHLAVSNFATRAPH
jgi:hypothetical protein